MRDIVSEIKNRLSIEDVVSQYVSLKKVGRSYKALSPFQQEKTPSFVVSPEKQIAYCFSTHRGGDMFKFIEEIEGVDFPEAVKILADKAGIEVPTKFAQKSAKEKGSKSLREGLLDVHERAATHYQGIIRDDSKQSKMVLEYLYKRGMTDELIDKFRVGFAPDKPDDLKKFLLKEGAKKEILEKSGLFIIRDTAGGDVLDKFRGRLMIPILDHMGRVIAFGGRALKKDQMPKYLNSPDTPLYLKRNVLYGLSHAKNQIREKDAVVFVEGYFDVIMLHKIGIENICASSGTALSPEQINLVKRFTKNIISCFDTDRAGIDATKRAFEVLQPFDMGLKSISMPAGLKDPADFVVEHGATAPGDFKDLIEGSKDFIDFYSNRLKDNYELGSIDGRKAFLNELIPLIKSVKSSVRIDFYVRLLAKIIGTKEKVLYEEIASFKMRNLGPSKKNEEVEDVSQKISTQEILLSLCLEYPKIFEIVTSRVVESDFEGDLKDIYLALVDQYNASVTSKEGWNLDAKKYASISGEVDILSLYGEERYSEFPEEIVTLEAEKLIDKIEKGRRMYKRLDLERRLKEAEDSGDKAKKEKLLKEFMQLLKS